jgi:succinyl-diaminopimelate desuccinylase
VTTQRTLTTVDAGIDAACRHIDAHELVTTLRALVRTRSVFDPAVANGTERAVAELVGAHLRRWGIDYVAREVAPGRPNIVADIRGRRGDGPVLILEGHTDVVTAGDPRGWSVDPFGGEIRDGRLYGRGACDMKGGLAALLYAARAINASGRDFAGTLRLAILADEEGLMLGAKRFVADGYLDGATAAIICEPEGDRVCVAQKGAIRLRVELHGKMAHGCMPEQGANPLLALGEVIHACRALEAVIQGQRQLHALLGTFTMTPTVAIGGERQQGNVIPARAELVLDIRTTSEHDHDDVRARVERAVAEAVAGVQGVQYDFATLDDRPATETPVEDPIVQAAIAAHEAETGTRPPLGGVPGSTDGTIFWAATGIPLVTWGPGETTVPHQADEYVEIEQVTRYARMYVAAALRYFDLLERR